jgi:hypothetical protein
MNPDYIKSAKIAADTAANNAKLAAIVAIVTAAIALIGIIVSSIISYKGVKNSAKVTREIGKGNISSLEKRRLIDTISAQRIEWINKLRDEFVQFNKKTHTMSMLILSTKKGENTDYNFGNDYQEIIAFKNHIELLVNPTEFFSKKIIDYLERVLDSLISDDFNAYKINKDYLSFIQQVILKAEWKRIKIETEKGEQINKEQMNEIFVGVAKEIDPDKYNKIYLFPNI